MAQAPRTNMTTVDGSGIASSAGPGTSTVAWATSATRPAHTRVKITFMPCSMPHEAVDANKLKTQMSSVRTMQTSVTSSSVSHRLRYLGAVVLALLFNGQLVASEPSLVELKLPAQFDPFDVGAQTQYEAAALQSCAVPKSNGFVGYRWKLPALAASFRQRSGESPGKQIYVAFLKSKYGYQIAALNADYGTDAQSFTELLGWPMKRGVAAHDAEFDSAMRQEMVEGILGALRKCDPKHAAGSSWLMVQLLATSPNH